MYLNSKVFVESEQDGFNLRMGNGNPQENEVFEIGMSIFYAIVNGYVIKLIAYLLTDCLLFLSGQKN